MVGAPGYALRADHGKPESTEYLINPFAQLDAHNSYVDVVAGVDLLSSGGSTLRLDYTGQFSRNSSSNAVWVKYSIPF